MVGSSTVRFLAVAVLWAVLPWSSSARSAVPPSSRQGVEVLQVVEVISPVPERADSRRLLGEVQNRTGGLVSFVKVSAELYDSTAQLLDTVQGDAEPYFLEPMETAIFDLRFPASLPVASWKLNAQHQAANQPRVTGISTALISSALDAAGYLEVRASATNIWTQPLPDIVILVSLYDRTGRLVNRDTERATKTGGIMPGETVSARLLFGPPNRADHIEVAGLTDQVQSRAVTGDVQIQLESPGEGANVRGRVSISGWAVNTANPGGPGLDTVRLFLDGPEGTGTPLPAPRPVSRPDVAGLLGNPRYADCGFELEADMPPGSHVLYVYAYNSTSGFRSLKTVSFTVEP